MTEPLVVEFTVETPPHRAFSLWADRAAAWGPRGHTVGGADDFEIVFEGWPGGRVFERTAAGVEHDWGEIVEWDPPNRIRYLWHLFFDRSEATTVEVRFLPVGDAATEVTITQVGFERLGEAGRSRRERTGDAWAVLSELYAAACSQTGSG